MTLTLGKQQLSLLNPPCLDDYLIDLQGKQWTIKRNSCGLIVLRIGAECHPEFLSGMDLEAFAWWFNSHFGAPQKSLEHASEILKSGNASGR